MPRPDRPSRSLRLVALVTAVVLAEAAPVVHAQPVRAPRADAVTETPAPRRASRVRKVDRRRLLAVNVGLTSLFTLARGVVGGSVHGAGDGAEALGWGAVAGLGFYLAKDAVGRGHEPLGVGLAFASASLAENAARGGGAFGHARVGFGPIDLRLRTPLATDEDGPNLAAEVDPLSAAALVGLPLRGGRPIIRGGLLLYVFDDLGTTRYYRRRGNTIGRVARVDARAQDLVVRHEMVHQIQAIQVGAVTPYGTLGALWPEAAPTSADGAVQWDARVDWLYLVLGGANLLLADDPRGRPSELEAYELDEPPAAPADR